MTYCGGCHVTSCNSVVRRAEQWSLFEMWVLWSLPTACLLSAQRSVLEGGRERGVWTMSVFLFCTLLVLWLACLNWGFSHTHRLACGLSNDVSVRSWVLKDCLLICTVHLASQQTFLASYFSECIEYKVACMIQVLLTSWNCYISTPSHTLLSFSDTRTLKIQQCKCKTHGFRTYLLLLWTPQLEFSPTRSQT